MHGPSPSPQLLGDRPSSPLYVSAHEKSFIKPTISLLPASKTVGVGLMLTEVAKQINQLQLILNSVPSALE